MANILTLKQKANTKKLLKIKRKPILVVTHGLLHGVGKSYAHRLNKIGLIIGENEKHKTSDIIKSIKRYISEHKKRKETWNIIIVTDKKENYKSLKPSKLSKQKNIIMITDFIDRVVNFQNTLFVIDVTGNYLKTELAMYSYISVHRSNNNDFVFSFKSFSDVHPKLAQNTNYIKIFNYKSLIAWQHDKKTQMMFNETVILATGCLYYSLYFRDNEPLCVTVDLDNSKIYCKQDDFALASYAYLDRIEHRTIAGMKEYSKQLLAITDYYGGEQK